MVTAGKGNRGRQEQFLAADCVEFRFVRKETVRGLIWIYLPLSTLNN